ncbi:MAG TPA: transcription termination/antitermination NusG family protein [Verrucomicrobiae bacterium]|jgi:transcriptional antiterminator RfaH|nr:transcription termination/antitermination NusG family protein [Verrucomicrobiae bacterium]
MREADSTSQMGLVDANAGDQRFWFCVQTHPKHEHIAAGSLAKKGGFEVFNPQIRTRKATRRGPVWFIESAFPGYVFVRFNLRLHINVVRYSYGVSRIVHFKSGYPSIPDEQINDLRSVFGSDEVLILNTEVSIGDRVRIVGGAFHDLSAIVHQIRPARQRVQALLEFLGRVTMVEIDLQNIVVENGYKPPSGLENHPRNFPRAA